MARQSSDSKESGSRLIAMLSFFWALIFIVIALILFISRVPERPVQPGDSLLIGKPFPLRGAPAESFALVGSTLVRIEEEGLAALDASGRELDFTSFPYRRSQVRAMGEGLLVTPVDRAGYMAVFADLSSHESDTREIIYGGDLREPLLLTFGTSIKGRLAASLFDARTGGYCAVLTFSSLEWPVSLAFVPGADQFDVLMLDLSQGKTATRYLRFDFEGKRLSDALISADDVFPLRVCLGGGEVLFYNEAEWVCFDPRTGMIQTGSLPGMPVQAAEGGGRFVLLAENEGSLRLYAASPDRLGDGQLFQALEAGEGISTFALTPDGTLILAAAGSELMTCRMDTGQVVARRAAGGPVKRILALSSQHFLVIDEKEAVIVTVR